MTRADIAVSLKVGFGYLRRGVDWCSRWLRRNTAPLTFLLVVYGFFFGTPWEKANLDSKYHGVLAFQLDHERKLFFADLTNPDGAVVDISIDWPKRCAPVALNNEPSHTRFFGASLAKKGASFDLIEKCLRNWALPLATGAGIIRMEGMVYPIFVDVRYSVQGKQQWSRDLYFVTTTIEPPTKDVGSTGMFRIESISFRRARTAAEEKIQNGEEEIDRRWDKALKTIFLRTEN